MSDADIKAVGENWTVVRDDIIGVGCNIFKELFKLNDSYADMFRGIRESGEIATGNPKLREHAVRVLTALDSIIIALVDPPVLEGLLLRQGAEHIPRKVFQQHFTDIKKALIVVLGNTLGGKFNLPAFDRVFNKIIATLVKGQQG